MRFGLAAGLVVELTIFFACAETFAAETPAPPAAATVPPTLWSFLGLKQCADKCKQHVVVHKEKKVEKQALQGGHHACLKRLFGHHCPCACGQCELLKKKPPVKPLADPANRESQNPAIKAAAEIKTEEDLAPQKIKAIRYLATIGCGCYPQVKPALLAALDDCTEEVRYEAALAFWRSAGNPCTVCNSSTCCDPEVREKLRDLAGGTDEHDCWKEPSSRVRSAASGALNRCEMIAPPELVPEEEPRELPSPEMAPLENTSEAAALESESGTLIAVGPPVGVIRVFGGPSDDPHASAPARLDEVPGIERAIPATARHERGSDGIPALAVGRSKAIGSGTAQRPSPDSQQKPGTDKPLEEAESELPWDEGALPGEVPPSEDLMAPSPLDLAGTFGAAPGPHSAAPYMIGDFFGGTACQATIVRTFTFNDLLFESDSVDGFYTVLQDQDETRVARHTQFPQEGPVPIVGVNDASAQLGGAPLEAVPAGGTFLDGVTTFQGDDSDFLTSQFQMGYAVAVASPGTGGGVGRMKIADNTSPMPRDRLIFDYSYFDNVPLVPGGVGINRFKLGIEKTFLDGDMSFEVKVPMASTVSSTVVQGTEPDQHSGEFGNLALAVKMLLRRTETWAVSGGLQVGLPTADDTRVVLPDGTPLLAIRNSAVHLAPFLGALWTPNERLFSHGFVQGDFATRGNAVLINDNGVNLSEIGRLNDASLLTVDWGIGYWAMRNSCRQRPLTGLAWTAELHWTRSLQNADTVESGPWSINCAESAAGGAGDGEIDVLNLTLGCHAVWREKTLVTGGYALPLYAGSGDPFDGEFRVMVNHHFGPLNRPRQFF